MSDIDEVVIFQTVTMALHKQTKMTSITVEMRIFGCLILV